MRRGFTILELLVVIGLIALLLGILLPTLGMARATARTVVCASNLRQTAMACRDYADRNRGFGPAIGWPWSAWPNWGVVALEYAREQRTHAADPFENAGGEPPDSIIVCPQVALEYTQTMTRTYAMNGTGHAGDPGAGDRPARADRRRTGRHADRLRSHWRADQARLRLQGHDHEPGGTGPQTVPLQPGTADRGGVA